MVGNANSHYRIIEKLGAGGIGRLPCRTAANSYYQRVKGSRNQTIYFAYPSPIIR
jgi:hypothetical protein